MARAIAALMAGSEVCYRYDERTRLDGSTCPHGPGRLTSVSEESGQSRAK